MLEWLRIDNYILIDHLNITFKPGFNVLTGPTGSGKSMITSALSILFGFKAQSGIALDDTKETIIQASLIPNQDQLDALSSYINEAGRIELTRQIKVNGKSIYKCCGRSIKVSEVIKLRQMHFCHRQQHQHLDLFNEAEHLNWLDDFAEIDRTKIEVAFLDWQKAKHQLNLLRQMKSSHDEVTIEHFYQELAEFFQNDFSYETLNEQLDVEAKKKQSLDEVKKVHQSMLANDMSDSITAIESRDPDNALIGPLTTFSSCQTETLNQITNFLNDQDDFGRYESLKETQHMWHELSRKHRCQPYALYDVFKQLEETIQTLANLDENEAFEVCKIAEKAYHEAAKVVTEQRQSQAIILAQVMTDAIQSLGMKHALFFINLVPTEPSKQGSERCEFLMSTNPGQMPQALKDTLSGGELSRVGLALQEHCSSQMKPIQLLDEVDVGISGQVAQQVAQLLCKRARKHQIIAISHLPQMAMMADYHGYISKGITNDQAVIGFKWLETDERIDGLAELIAGKEIDAAATAHAKQLLALAKKEKAVLI